MAAKEVHFGADARDRIEAIRMCEFLVCEYIAAAVAGSQSTNVAAIAKATGAAEVSSVWVNRSDLVRASKALQRARRSVHTTDRPGSSGRGE